MLCFAPAKSTLVSRIVHNYKAILQKQFLKRHVKADAWFG